MIIGYSFTDYNNKIDRKIIQSMVNLNSVIIKDIDTEVPEQRLKMILGDRKVKITTMSNLVLVNNFYVP